MQSGRRGRRVGLCVQVAGPRIEVGNLVGWVLSRSHLGTIGRNDNIEKIAPRRQLCMWHGPTPAMLDDIRNVKLEGATAALLEAVCHLVEWCLQDADKRPSMDQVLAHTAFNPDTPLPAREPPPCSQQCSV